MVFICIPCRSQGRVFLVTQLETIHFKSVIRSMPLKTVIFPQSSVAKKPYNPILGETFRCFWVLPECESSRTEVSYKWYSIGKQWASKQLSFLSLLRQGLYWLICYKISRHFHDQSGEQPVVTWSHEGRAHIFWLDHWQNGKLILVLFAFELSFDVALSPWTFLVMFYLNCCPRFFTSTASFLGVSSVW